MVDTRLAGSRLFGSSVTIFGAASMSRPIPSSMGEIWAELLRGQLILTATSVSMDRCFFTLRRRTSSRVPSKVAVSIAERVFMGEQPKVIAYEHGLSVATVCHHTKCVVDAVSRAPHPATWATFFVIAACAVRGARVPPARLEGLDHDGNTVLGVALPMDLLTRTTLSEAERAIAWGVVAGKSHAELRGLRGTSPRTVANQLSSVYRKLNLSGRRQLMTAAFSAWFDPASVQPANSNCSVRGATQPSSSDLLGSTTSGLVMPGPSRIHLDA